jgi:hypothetical protein
VENRESHGPHNSLQRQTPDMSADRDNFLTNLPYRCFELLVVLTLRSCPAHHESRSQAAHITSPVEATGVRRSSKTMTIAVGFWQSATEWFAFTAGDCMPSAS